MSFSEVEYQQLLRNGRKPEEKTMARNRRTSGVPSLNPRGGPNGARSKFNAVKTEVDGIVFDSKKEAQRYHELKLLEKAGHIQVLTLQPEYDLTVEDKCIGIYRADFYYFDAAGQEVIEDVKGMKTPLYRWKKKHFEAQYGIQIRET